MELLLKIFNKIAYWNKKVSKLAKEEREARYAWRDALEHHRKSKDLRFKYELCALRVNKAYPEYLKAIGRV